MIKKKYRDIDKGLYFMAGVIAGYNLANIKDKKLKNSLRKVINKNTYPFRKWEKTNNVGKGLLKKFQKIMNQEFQR